MKRILSGLLLIVMLLGIFTMIPPVRAVQGSKLVAITFDDGPGGYTARLLDGLRDRGAKATFFMVGNRVNGNLDVVRRVYTEGHQVANHSWSHLELTAESDSSITNEVNWTNNALNQVCGKGTSYYFRAPYGSTNSRVRSLIGMPLVYWSVDTLDWQSRNATSVKNMILNYVHDGAIILLHDIHSTSVDGALAAIDVLKEQGYEFVTVRELYRRRGITPAVGCSHTSCEPNGTDLGPVAQPVITTTVNGSHLTVTMTAQEGAQIYYTTDGSCPNQESPVYTGPIAVEAPCTFTAAAAYNMNGSRSDLTVQTVSIPPMVAPELNVKEGVMTLSSTNKQAKIFYTLNGKEATSNDLAYTEPVTLEPNTVICAMATASGYLDSAQVRGYYSKNGNFFRDVFPYHWYCDTIDQAASAGYMNGMGNNRFAPDKLVSRGQLVTMLYRYAEGQHEELTAVFPFTDVHPNSYYFEAIAWAYQVGIINGYGNGLFCPDKPITRQEMCKVFSTFLEYRGYTMTGSQEQSVPYQDVDKISSWALPYVEHVTAAGLFKGDTKGCFLPLNNATRAQAATVLIRLATLKTASPEE